MTHRILGLSAAALGMAAFAGLCAPGARAEIAPTTPSLSEPAPTPSWAEAGPSSTENGAAATPRRTRAHARHAAWRTAHRTGLPSENPVAAAATGVVGGVADLGSVAAYPFYCFPNYGSCSVRLPYRY